MQNINVRNITAINMVNNHLPENNCKESTVISCFIAINNLQNNITWFIYCILSSAFK